MWRSGLVDAVAWRQPLALKLPHGLGVAQKKKKKREERQGRRVKGFVVRVLSWWWWGWGG